MIHFKFEQKQSNIQHATSQPNSYNLCSFTYVDTYSIHQQYMHNEISHELTSHTAHSLLQLQPQSNNNMHELYIQIIMQHKKQQTFLPFNLVLHLSETSTLLSASLSCFSSTTNTPSYTLDEG